MTAEKALFSNVPVNKDRLSGITLLYFGEEFCQRKLPSAEQAGEMLDFAKAHGLKPVLVTPPITEEGTPTAEKLLSLLAKSVPDLEIVFNDWGVLEMAKNASPDFRLTAGRVRMARYDYLDSLPEEFLAFMKGQGVTRLEFNSAEGLAIHRDAAHEAGIETSLYWPHKFLTYTRYCPQTLYSGKYVRDAIESCGRECEKVYAVMRHTMTAKEIRVCGNAWLADAPPLPDNCPAGRIILNAKS